MQKMANDTTNTAIVKWNEVGTALVLYTQKQDEKTLRECIDIMIGGIRFVAPYASTVASFVKPMVIPDPVMLELNKINEQLSDINKKLDKIVSEIKDELKLNEYNKYLNKLYKMQSLYARFIQTPNTVTLDALNKQSDRNQLFDFVNWLHREVTAQNLNPIIDYMKADDDYPKFIKWTQLILTHYAQAMLLHGISVQLRPNVKKLILDQTLENDTTLFEKNLREMTNEFTKFVSHLKQSYFNKLEEKSIIHVKTLLSALEDQALADAMYDYVSAKYPFRDWFVCVINTGGVVIYPFCMKEESHFNDFYDEYEDRQAITLFVCEKDGKSFAASSEKIFREINLSNPFTRYGYSNYRTLFITSTLADNSKYNHDVSKYLSGIDEKTFCKYDGWFQPYEGLCKNTAKVVLEGLPLHYSSQILCATNRWHKLSYKYSDRASVCFRKRPVKGMLGLINFDVEIITIKKGQIY